MKPNYLKIVECPRDAMQGFHRIISTDQKVRYLRALLNAGFPVLDFGSFVSPKAVPQMADTTAVLAAIDKSEFPNTELLAIVASKRGALEASTFDEINSLGYPFSISETFQLRNTHKNIKSSFELVQQLLDITEKSRQELVVYLSMGFGNPYKDDWSLSMVEDWTGKLIESGVKVISLSDTVGTASVERLGLVTQSIINLYSEIEVGVHMHTSTTDWYAKVDGVWKAGCRRLDGAIQGFGGCPFAEDELVGNLPTEKILTYCAEHSITHNINLPAFESAYNEALKTFA
jgi:hydroxymethylglutaryl-CoA lyase